MQRKTIRVWTVGTGILLGAFVASPTLAFWGTQSATTCDAACEPCAQHHGTSGAFYDYLETGRQANAMWPYPYICPDRVWAHAPFDVMVVNGWRRQNLLGAHHFNPETGKLTRAGELKVQWILTQTPPDRRQVYVERAMESNVTEARVATTQAFANGLNIEGGEALVQDTHIRSPRRPAGMVDSERTSFIEGRPPAVLPTGSRSTAASSN
jgi:hypothetical protein